MPSLGLIKGSVSDVKGSCEKPTIQGAYSSTGQYASFWVGIDGYSSNTVEQVGTDSDCPEWRFRCIVRGRPYPHPSFTVDSVPISPGNIVSAEPSR